MVLYNMSVAGVRVVEFGPKSAVETDLITYCKCVCVCVCVRVSVLLQTISNSYKRILMKFCGEVGPGPGRRNRLDSGGDPGSFVDPGLFSRILYH